MTQDIATGSSSEVLRKSRAPPADAWCLTDAARAFASDDDLAESERLNREIKQKEESISALELHDNVSETVKKMAGWDYPSATQAEIDERRSQGWSDNRIDNWMHSRYNWLRAVARTPAATSAEIEAGSLREDFSSYEAAQKEADLIIKNYKIPRKRELDSLLHQEKCLATRGLLAALKSGDAIAWGRHQSLREPFDIVPAAVWNNQLVFEVDPSSDNLNSVRSTDGAVFFADVQVALTKKVQRERTAADAKSKSSALAKKQCGDWLVSEMEKNPKKRPKKKAEYLVEAQTKFDGLSERSFNAEWTAAIKTTASLWNLSGAPAGRRPKKSSH